MALTRHPENPILTRADIPGDVTSVFNPGATLLDGGGTVLLLRVQTRGRETRLYTARGADGVSYYVSPEPVVIDGLADAIPERVYHVYDPRITRIDATWFITLALDTDDGCRMAIAETADFVRFALVAVTNDSDTRNGVLFPERVGGRFARLDRPNTRLREGSPASGDEIVLSYSDDLRFWEPAGSVMTGRKRYWDELIGPGPPPVRTRHGWLLVYHGVATHFAGVNVYQAGVALLDPENPARVIGRSRENLLEPRETYELTGQVPNVVFPSGLTVALDENGVAPDDATVNIYYGAADTCVCLATTTVGDLVAACTE